MEATYDIYTVITRNDMDYNMLPGAQWPTTGSAGPYYANILQQMWYGLAEMTGSPSSSFSNYNFPSGLTPFDIAKFCSYFKIIKRKLNNVLIGGGYKTYTVKDKKWRLWDGTKIYQCNGSQNVVDTAFGRRTKTVFILMRGQGVSDVVNTQNVALAPCNIITTGKERFMFTGTNTTTKRIIMQNTYNAVGTMSTVDLQTEEKEAYVVA
jgi:hypothetical protein